MHSDGEGDGILPEGERGNGDVSAFTPGEKWGGGLAEKVGGVFVFFVFFRSLTFMGM